MSFTGFPRLLEILDFIPKISRPSKVLENEFGPGKSWKLQFKVLESPGIYVWFILYSRHSSKFGLTET